MRRIASTALFLSAPWIGPAVAQAPAAKSAPAKFEVVTLKPSQAQGPNGGIRPAPGGERYVAQNCPLRLMITVAYGVKGSQITGGPDWIDTDRWDMNGKAEKQSTIQEFHEMLRDVLAENFKLKFHKATKEMPLYALRVDKSGTKLQPKQFANAGEPWVDVQVRNLLQMTLSSKVVTMDYFAFRLSQMLDRPVRNFTELPGNYDFELAYTRDLPPGVSEGATFNGQTVDTSGPTIFEAVRRQLGLTLQPEKGPVDTIVIDSVEKPSGN